MIEISPEFQNSRIPEFQSFPKMGRLSRDCVITEKIDGTNAQLYVPEDLNQIFVGSRNRWITPSNDNYGFAGWVQEHKTELLALGPGRHFGEWWGAGIQRRYGMNEKVFSLFNVHKWAEVADVEKKIEIPPACCRVVPVLYRGPFIESAIEQTLRDLASEGSAAAEGFMDPEGIVIYHEAAKTFFKKTIKEDASVKSVASTL